MPFEQVQPNVKREAFPILLIWVRFISVATVPKVGVKDQNFSTKPHRTGARRKCRDVLTREAFPILLI